MIIFVHGCSSCGINGILIRKIQKYANSNGIELDVRNSKYNETDRIEHGIKLSLAGISMDSYQPIVVEGEKVTRLREWTS